MLTLHLYGIPNCNSVKKARDWLTANNVDFIFHDFKKIELSDELLTNWLVQIAPENLVNRAGSTWRALDETTKLHLQTKAAYRALMQQKPSVIKRPVLEKDGKIICLGFDAQRYAKVCA